MEPVQARDGPPVPYALPSAPSVGCSFGSARTAILDTDYILNQVARLVDDPVAAVALLGPPFGRERTFASSHVPTELHQADKLGYRNKWEKLAAQAHDRGIVRSPRDYQDMFESTVLPLITFVDMTGMFEDDPATEAVRAADPRTQPLRSSLCSCHAPGPSSTRTTNHCGDQAWPRSPPPSRRS